MSFRIDLEHATYSASNYIGPLEKKLLGKVTQKNIMNRIKNISSAGTTKK